MQADLYDEDHQSARLETAVPAKIREEMCVKMPSKDKIRWQQCTTLKKRMDQTISGSQSGLLLDPKCHPKHLPTEIFYT